MRNLLWVACVLAGCGGYEEPTVPDGGANHHDLGSRPSQHDGFSNPQTIDDLGRSPGSDGGMQNHPITDAGPADCPIPCGAGTYCNNGSCAPLQTNCPCPLGSYCDLTDMTCKGGCRTDEHCPVGQICDTRRYQCARDCGSHDVDCGHFDCVYLDDGRQICGSCDATKCECKPEEWGDCNMDPSDGCETDLDTLANCEECGVPASTDCLVDADHDGYGVKGSDTTLCHCENGYIYPSTQFGQPLQYDCDDADPNTHPGASYFPSPNPQGSWDYNCNGLVEKYVLTATTDANCTQFDECAPVATNVPCGATYTVSYCTFDSSNNQCDIVSYMGAEPCQ